jgi:cyclohexyl-isocyanide hydratase
MFAPFPRGTYDQEMSVSQSTPSEPLNVGILIFPELDQLDFTGPFEVLARMPDSKLHLIWKSTAPIKDMMGLVLQPTTAMAAAPRLDVVVVPGGYGQQALMDDEEVLGFLRAQAKHAKYMASVCTGALVLGAAGLLKGYRATTHWTAVPLLKYVGAVHADERVVVDRDRVTCGGVTSGIDGALQLVALLRGEQAAQEIQLYMEYSPAPPFTSGSPGTAPAPVLEAVKKRAEKMFLARSETCKRVAGRIGVPAA